MLSLVPTTDRAAAFELDAASFRDPHGFVFRGEGGTLYRQINRSYEADYKRLMSSGLYDELVEAGLLIPHEEVGRSHAVSEEACQVIQPRELPFISYPYEWPFSALRDAALLTLDVQRRALRYGLSLKDASAYNIQFEGVHPIFIDTLSFETYRPGAPWNAYNQFCRHFLAPLALMARTDIRLGQLLERHVAGVPLDLAAKLLPKRTRLNPGLLVHLHLQAKMVTWHSDTSRKQKTGPSSKTVSREALTAIIAHLEKTVSRLSWRPAGTTWADYYDSHAYNDEAFLQKQRAVAAYVDRVHAENIWDFGANTGVFSQIAAGRSAAVCAFDIDPACVDLNYRHCRDSDVRNVLPLLLDLTNPTPAIGWAHQERKSLVERGPADLVMALALIHHLAISNNVSFERIADFLHQAGRHLIIEYVPKHDPQVRRLLRSREDVFDRYDQTGFEKAFRRRFEISDSQPIGTDGRVLYLMEST
jgi:ribosomal protein L11 methylase PrmA